MRKMAAIIGLVVSGVIALLGVLVLTGAILLCDDGGMKEASAGIDAAEARDVSFFCRFFGKISSQACASSRPS